MLSSTQGDTSHFHLLGARRTVSHLLSKKNKSKSLNLSDEWNKTVYSENDSTREEFAVWRRLSVWAVLTVILAELYLLGFFSFFFFYLGK